MLAADQPAHAYLLVQSLNSFVSVDQAYSFRQNEHVDIKIRWRAPVLGPAGQGENGSVP